MANYRTAVAEWRESRSAYLAIGVPTSQAGPPPLMPGCPSHLPSEVQLQAMIARARKEGKDAYRRVMAPSSSTKQRPNGAQQRGSRLKPRGGGTQGRKTLRSPVHTGTEVVCLSIPRAPRLWLQDLH